MEVTEQLSRPMRHALRVLTEAGAMEGQISNSRTYLGGHGLAWVHRQTAKALEERGLIFITASERIGLARPGAEAK